MLRSKKNSLLGVDKTSRELRVRRLLLPGDHGKVGITGTRTMQISKEKTGLAHGLRFCQWLCGVVS